MTEPRKCPEPGCGRKMEEQFTRFVDVDGNTEVAWVCPNPEQHKLAALRARNAELEGTIFAHQQGAAGLMKQRDELKARLSESLLRESILMDAVKRQLLNIEQWLGGGPPAGAEESKAIYEGLKNAFDLSFAAPLHKPKVP